MTARAIGPAACVRQAIADHLADWGAIGEQIARAKRNAQGRGVLDQEVAEAIRGQETFARAMLSEDAIRALRRLLSDPSACKAFKALATTKFVGKIILVSYIEAESMYRNFNSVAKAERRSLKGSQTVERAVKIIQIYLRSIDHKSTDSLSSYLESDLWRSVSARRGLEAAADILKNRRRDSEEMEARLGATRKAAGESAARTAALRFLAEKIELATGKPNTPFVADIAVTLFGRHDVTLKAVIHAVKSRKRRAKRSLQCG